MSVTQFSEVYPYGLNGIDDIRLEQLKVNDPALYLNRLWAYLQNAIPYFTSPQGIQDKINDYVEPEFSDFDFVGDGETTVFVVDKEKEFVCVENAENEPIAVIITAQSTSVNGVTYDPIEGTLTFDTAPDYEFYVDLYTDGYFNSKLNIQEMAILGIAFRLCWFKKIANTFLRTTPKIKDKNFNMDSSWGVEQADTARVKALKVELVDAMADYEQYLAYKAVVPSSRQLLHKPEL